MTEPYARLQPPFPVETYARHITIVQDDLRRHGLAAIVLFDPENLYWLTGYRSIGYFTFQALVVLANGAPVMVSRQVNHAIVSGNDNIGGFVPIADTDDPVAVLAGFLREHVQPAYTIGLETGSNYLTVRDWRALNAALPGQIADWDGVIEQARTIKTPEQIERMRHAARAAVAGIDAAVRAIVPGCTENDLAAAMLHGATQAGSEFTRVPLVCTGRASGVCFTTWERRPVRRGDLVFLEAGANIDRYHAMIARNCTVGPATSEQKRLAQVVIDALDRTIEAIRPGVTSSAVDAVCRGVFEAAGLAHYFDHRTAYGIGIGFPPNWAEGRFLAIKPGDPTRLESGMTFHLVPSAFMPSGGYMMSESIAVTEDGCEVLTNYPRQLIEVDV